VSHLRQGAQCGSNGAPGGARLEVTAALAAAAYRGAQRTIRYQRSPRRACYTLRNRLMGWAVRV